MRLTDEQLEFIKKWMAKCEEKDEIPTNGMTIGRLLEHIEALQQENERLQAQVAQYREALEEATETIENIYEKDTPQTEKYRDILNVGTTEYHNPADVAEIEKLQAQLESLRCTSCGEIPATIGTDDGQYCEKCAEELDAVEMIDLLNYHNPADVEALKQAKEALSAWDTVNWCDCDRCKNMRDALAAIDKIGGKEDAGKK